MPHLTSGPRGRPTFCCNGKAECSVAKTTSWGKPLLTSKINHSVFTLTLHLPREGGGGGLDHPPNIFLVSKMQKAI